MLSNSLPTDKLENWCHERLAGALLKYEAELGGFHGNHMSWNQPCQQPPTSIVTLFSVEILT